MFVYMYILEILKQVKQFYIRVPVQMIHVLALSEWMCEKKQFSTNTL